MTTRSSRLSRGSAAAAFATWAAAFSHEAAGGGHPALTVMALALLVSVPASVWLAGRRYSRIRVAVSIALSQLAFHALFSFFGPATSGSAADTVAASPHNHALLLTPSAASASTTLDAAMIAFHSAAAAATILFVFYGERCARLALARGRKAVAPLVRASALTATPPVGPLRASVAAVVRVVRARELAPLIGGLRHRGPPRSLSHA